MRSFSVPLSYQNLSLLAQEGDPIAQFRFGNVLKERVDELNTPIPQLGSDLTPEEINQEAVKWYTAAMEQGHAEAAHCLAQLIEASSASEGPSCLNRAFMLYRRSADMGFLPAYLNLSFLYKEGLAVPMDLAMALDCLKKASDLGLSQASYEIGEGYNYGYSGLVEKDESEAFKWYLKAYLQGSGDACEQLAVRHCPLICKEDCSPGQVKLATLWYKKGAELGNRRCREMLELWEKDGSSSSIISAPKNSDVPISQAKKPSEAIMAGASIVGSIVGLVVMGIVGTALLGLAFTVMS